MMKSIHKLTCELQEAKKMYRDCMRAWGIPNGWDLVQKQLEKELRDAQTCTEAQIPEEYTHRSLQQLALEVTGIEGNAQGRYAELELLRRLKQRKHSFTIQGPASVIYKEKGILRFRSIPAFATFSGKFLAYSDASASIG